MKTRRRSTTTQRWDATDPGPIVAQLPAAQPQPGPQSDCPAFELPIDLPQGSSVREGDPVAIRRTQGSLRIMAGGRIVGDIPAEMATTIGECLRRGVGYSGTVTTVTAGVALVALLPSR